MAEIDVLVLNRFIRFKEICIQGDVGRDILTSLLVWPAHNPVTILFAGLWVLLLIYRDVIMFTEEYHDEINGYLPVVSGTEYDDGYNVGMVELLLRILND